jgi:hypothetical protein
MYLKKEISISFFRITISASNPYMPMIWSYVFLLDFLIPFLCGPDLQCSVQNPTYEFQKRNISSIQENISSIQNYQGLSFLPVSFIGLTDLFPQLGS